MSELIRKKTSDKNGQGDEEGKLKSSTKSGREIFIYPEYTVDSLPPELWARIFKNVESPKDLFSCWNTTPIWHSGLRSNDFYFKMTLPFLLPHLSAKDILVCSSVSKSWNASVDFWTQNAEDFGSDQRLNQEQKCGLWNHLDSGTMLDFILRFGLSSNNVSGDQIVAINPATFARVGVSLSLQALQDNNGEFRHHHPEPIPNIFSFNATTLLKCLDYFGKLIRHLSLDIFHEEVNEIDKLLLIKRCLERTPNLRVLVISYISTSDSMSFDERVTAFNDYISRNPWPALEHLKVLKFGFSTNMEEFASIANTYAPQLLYLQFSFPMAASFQPLTNRFSCLQKIRYYFVNENSAVNFGTFIQSAQCPLKHMYVEFWWGSYPATLEHYQEVTLAANAVSDTLETLYVDRGDRSWSKQFEFGVAFTQLRLPVLKKLELRGFGLPSLHLLQNVCPAIQQLIVIEPSSPEAGSWKISEHGATSCNSYSLHQFWTQMTHIEKVILGSYKQPELVKVYTRSGYEVVLKKDDNLESMDKLTINY